MIIDRKLHDLVEYLINLKEPEKITNIAKNLNQNRRVIYYNLEKINYDLTSNSTCNKIANTNKVGIIIDEKQRTYLKQFLSSYDETMYFFNIEERQLLISVLIAASSQKVIIEMLMEICCVSRNTIVSDLRDIKDRIKKSEFNVSLGVNKKSGYFIVGDDLERVQYIYSLLSELYNYKNGKLHHRINSVLYKENIMYGTAFYIGLTGQIENARHILGKEISLNEKQKFIFIFPYIIQAARKMSTGIKFNNKNLLLQRVEYSFIDKITAELTKAHNILFSNDEKILLTMIVLCLKKDIDEHNSSEDYKYLKENLEKMVEIFELNAGVTFNEKEKFIDRLITHFKALLFRKKYNIVANNVLAETIVNNYEEVFLITKLSVKYLETIYKLKFTRSDIAYISLHFGSKLVNSRQKINKVKKVLIITSEQYSIKKLIENQCKYYLKNCIIIGITSEDKMSKYMDYYFDFIITTENIKYSLKPYVLVSPLMTIDDINKILNFTQTMNYTSMNIEADDRLEKLLSEYISDKEDIISLKMKIKQIYNRDYYLGDENKLSDTTINNT